jgi:hypothetical protein
MMTGRGLPMNRNRRATRRRRHSREVTAAMLDPLKAKRVEWQRAICDTLLELRLLKGSMPHGDGWLDVPSSTCGCATTMGATLEEAASDVDRVADELKAMTRATLLLGRVSQQLDAEGRAQLKKAIDLLCTVDWATRLDCLYGELYTLRKGRTALAAN